MFLYSGPDGLIELIERKLLQYKLKVFFIENKFLKSKLKFHYRKLYVRKLNFSNTKEKKTYCQH